MEQLTVLVVDDDRIAISILNRMLDPYADKVLVASDGLEGLALFKKYKPDIVLTDINMPRMGGLEMVEHIREIDELVKIAIFTNFENRNILIKAIQYGVNQFFSKPFEVKHFTQIIQHLCDDVLDKRRISCELARQQNVLHAINEMSHHFLQHNNWISVLNQEMEHLRNAAETSSIFIYQNDTQADNLSAQQLIAINNTPEATAKESIHYQKDKLMQWKKTLKRGKYIYGSIDEFDKSKQRLLKSFKIDSLLILPIFVGKEWWGFLGIGDVKQKSLNVTDIEMLSTVSSIIGSAINNRRNLQSLEMSSVVFEHTMDGVMITDRDNRISHVNNAFTTITGYEAEEVLGENPKLLNSGTHDKKFYERMWEKIEADGYWQGEVSNRKKNGEMYIEWLSVNVVRDAHGNIENHIGIFSDVTHQRKDAQNHAYLATHDPLTGLSNRLLFDDRLNHAIHHARRFDKHLAVIFCDLDDFKPINDKYGHAVGDKILKSIAAELKRILRKEDTVCRFGGDEFVILIEGLKTLKFLQGILQKIADIQKQTFVINRRKLSVGISIGTSLYPNDAKTPEALLECADVAMYRAKETKESSIAYYRADTDAYFDK